MTKKLTLFIPILIVILGVCARAENYSESSWYYNIEKGNYIYYVDSHSNFLYRKNTMTGTCELLLEKYVSNIEADETTLYVTIMDLSNGSFSIILCGSEEEKITFNTISTDEDVSLLSIEDEMLGTLSQKYESNGNPGSVSSGAGDSGGSSFGAYQFASNYGVPKTFADWCISSGIAPEIGNRLNNAYNNDGFNFGTNFKTEWKAIANENADRFLYVQHTYVKEHYYNAAVKLWENSISGFAISNYSIALKNVVWSRAVQHGTAGSKNVFVRAISNLGGFSDQDEATIIKAIYSESGAVVDTPPSSNSKVMTGTTAVQYGISGKYMKYFSSNSSAVQVSVYNRLNNLENNAALNMYYEYNNVLDIITPIDAKDGGWYSPDEDIKVSWNKINSANVYRYSVAVYVGGNNNDDSLNDYSQKLTDSNGNIIYTSETTSNSFTISAGSLKPEWRYKIWVAAYSGEILISEDIVYPYTTESNQMLPAPIISLPDSNLLAIHPDDLYIQWNYMPSAKTYRISLENTDKRTIFADLRCDSYNNIDVGNTTSWYFGGKYGSLEDDTNYKFTLTAVANNGNINKTELLFKTLKRPIILSPVNGRYYDPENLLIQWTGPSADYLLTIKDSSGNIFSGYDAKYVGKKYSESVNLNHNESYTVGICAVIDSRQLWAESVNFSTEVSTDIPSHITGIKWQDIDNLNIACTIDSSSSRPGRPLSYYYTVLPEGISYDSVILKNINPDAVTTVLDEGSHKVTITPIAAGSTQVYLLVDGYQSDVLSITVKDTATADPGGDIIKGDVNGDGEVDFMDAYLILRHDAGLQMISDQHREAADVNGDGEIDFMDAYMILRYDAGLVDNLN